MHVHIHVHRRKTVDKRRTRDEDLAALYEDLIDRMMAAAADLMATKDEWREELHPRRDDGKFGTGAGNVAQNTGAAKPTTTTAKAGKDKLRELFASGHAFTKQELLDATGMSADLLAVYIPHLKNPKFAGKLGALKIEKNAKGEFYVARADGTPAPAPPKEAPKVDDDDKSASARYNRMSASFAQAVKDHPEIVGTPNYTAAHLNFGQAARNLVAGNEAEAEKFMDRASTFMGHAAIWAREHRVEQAAKAKAAEAEAAAKAAARPKMKPWVPAKTTREASKRAVEHGLVDHSDFGRADVRWANDQMQSLSDHLQEFPALRDRQDFAGSMQRFGAWDHEKRARKYAEGTLKTSMLFKDKTDEERMEYALRRTKRIKAPPNGWAFASSHEGSSGVSLNEKFTKSSEIAKFERSLNYSVEQGFHPPGCNTVKSIADHEYGHQLDFLLGLSQHPEMRGIRYWAHGGESAHTARTAHEVPIGPDSKANVKKNVSQYAGTNMAEFIAESWAEYRNNPNPRPVAKAVGDLIKRVYAEKHPQ